MTLRLTISNLSKTYPNGVQALRGVSLDVGTGMFGLLGPNGRANQLSCAPSPHSRVGASS